MSNAPLRQSEMSEPALPFLEPDSYDEPKTEPRIRAPQLALPSDRSGVVPRAPAPVPWRRIRFAPAVLIGALIGSAPYLAQQQLRASSAGEPRIIAESKPSDVENETSQTAAVNAPGSAASQLYAAQPQPKAAEVVPPEAARQLETPSYLKSLDAADSSGHIHVHRPGPVRKLLASAKKQLQQGDALGAQLALSRLSRRAPRGALVQERKLLEIQVWLALGAKDKAQSAARDFARAYPHSPKLAKLTGLLLGS